MSKHYPYNYRNTASPVDEAMPAQVKEEVAEVLAEETTEVPAEETIDVAEVLLNEEPADATTEEEPTAALGQVCCEKLNVRKEPSTTAAVVSVVARDAILMIDADKSTEEWYKVYTEAGIEGYCMKKFVIIM